MKHKCSKYVPCLPVSVLIYLIRCVILIFCVLFSLLFHWIRYDRHSYINQQSHKQRDDQINESNVVFVAYTSPHNVRDRARFHLKYQANSTHTTTRHKPQKKHTNKKHISRESQRFVAYQIVVIVVGIGEKQRPQNESLIGGVDRRERERKKIVELLLWLADKNEQFDVCLCSLLFLYVMHRITFSVDPYRSRKENVA